MKRRRKLIGGPILLGFAEAFDRAWGKPSAAPPTVTPTRVGAVLLPFECPHCQEVQAEAVDPLKRDAYRDPDRGFSFCPSCEERYVLDARGVPLDKPLLPGAASAPARVERRVQAAVLGVLQENAA